jgi:MSHA biogenesis protein MshO
MNDRRRTLTGCRGFTLLEAVMVIVITGILGAVVAVFIRAPIEGYVASVSRAELTDAADTAVRRIARDVRTALPNSLRATSSASSSCFEFLPTVGGGRYRAALSGTGTGDILDFSVADSSFDVLAGTTSPLAAGTYHVVIYNLGIAGADAYNVAYKNRAQISSTFHGASVTLSAANQFPFASTGKRFHVIPDNSVAYSCSGGNLLRSTQAISLTPMASCPSSGTVLVSNVSSCSFSYNPAVSTRNGLLTIALVLTQSGESVRLYQEVHVNNVP